MKNKSVIGMSARFCNRAHYPSMHGKIVTIVSDYGSNEIYRFGIEYTDEHGQKKRMAANESEIQIIN
jgi:hypothetical protein